MDALETENEALRAELEALKLELNQGSRAGSPSPSSHSPSPPLQGWVTMEDAAVQATLPWVAHHLASSTFSFSKAWSVSLAGNDTSQPGTGPSSPEPEVLS